MTDAVAEIVKNMKAQTEKVEVARNARKEFIADSREAMVEVNRGLGGTWWNRFVIRKLYPAFLVAQVSLAVFGKSKDHWLHQKYHIERSRYSATPNLFTIAKKDVVMDKISINVSGAFMQ